MKCEYDYYYSDNHFTDKLKNEWIHDFLQTNATHLFMVDPGLSWDMRGMVRFLNVIKKGADVVSGAFPNKCGGFGVHIKTEDNYPVGLEGENYRILEVNSIVPGFIIFKREVFEKMKPDFSTYVKPTQFGEPEKVITEFFKTGNTKISEDIEFQKKVQEKGFKIFLEPNINFNYTGKKTWVGNYTQYLLGSPCAL